MSDNSAAILGMVVFALALVGVKAILCSVGRALTRGWRRFDCACERVFRGIHRWWHGRQSRAAAQHAMMLQIAGAMRAMQGAPAASRSATASVPGKAPTLAPAASPARTAPKAHPGATALREAIWAQYDHELGAAERKVADQGREIAELRAELATIRARGAAGDTLVTAN